MFNYKSSFKPTANIKINASFYIRQFFLLCFLAIALWLIFDYTNLDLYISSYFFDPQTASWPYYDTFFTKKIGYDWIKILLVIYGITLVGLLLYSIKNNFWQSRRKILIFLLLSMIVIPTQTALMKNIAPKSRPEQVVQFGGNMPHVKLNEFLFDQPTAKNWPGGHASGGAALMSFYFAGCYFSPFWRKTGLIIGISTSQFMGFIQVMRGQHFFSHNLWTLWFAWLSILILYFIVFRPFTLFPKKEPAMRTAQNNLLPEFMEQNMPERF